MHTNEDDLERLFGIAEVSRIIGLERSTVYDRIKSGRLRAVQLDGLVKVPRSAIKEYLAGATPLTVRA